MDLVEVGLEHARTHVKRLDFALQLCLPLLPGIAFGVALNRQLVNHVLQVLQLLDATEVSRKCDSEVSRKCDSEVSRKCDSEVSRILKTSRICMEQRCLASV